MLSDLKYGTIGNQLLFNLQNQFKLIDPFEITQLQPASYDLRLGESIKINLPNDEVNNEPIINPFKPMKYKEQILNDDEPIYMQPKDFFNVNTLEIIDLKSVNEYLVNKFGCGIEAQVCGKSSLARLGLVVENAGYIDPGFIGTITLELFNQEKYPILLKKGMLIAQIKFSVVNKLFSLYKGKYLNQQKATESRYFLNYTN